MLSSRVRTWPRTRVRPLSDPCRRSRNGHGGRTSMRWSTANTGRRTVPVTPAPRRRVSARLADETQRGARRGQRVADRRPEVVAVRPRVALVARARGRGDAQLAPYDLT